MKHMQSVLIALLCLKSMSFAFSLQPCTDGLCANGRCNAAKDACVCDTGYSGARCDQIDNALPQFQQTTYTAFVTDDSSAGTLVTSPSASDPDALTRPSCECATVRYSLETADGSAQPTLFAVDPTTGQVTTAMSSPPVGTYRMRLRAFNPGAFAASGAATAELSVTVEEVLSRQRRSPEAPPSNVTFNYRQLYPTSNVTHLKMGEKLAFQVDIKFPAGTTTMNMEMFSPDNETVAVIMICDAKIASVGKNLNLDVAKVMASATYEGRGTSKWPYVRIALPFGNVTNNASGSVEPQDMTISVTYEAVFLYNTIVANNSEYWVSAGAEYNNESVIWIGQTSFLTNTDPTSATVSKETPVMNITGDSSIYPGVVSSFNLDFTVPYLYSNFTLDIFAPLNNSELMSVCGVYTSAGSGSGFGCVPQSSWPYDFTLTKQQVSFANYYRSTLSFTSTMFTNKAYRMPNSTTDDHRVSFTFAVKPNESATVGTNTYIGASVDIGGTTVLSGYKSVTVASASSAPVSSNTTLVDPVITLTRIGPGILSQDQSTMFELAVDTVPNSRLDYEIQALMPANSSLGRMKICSMNVTYAGRNVPCLNQQLTSIAAAFQVLYSNGSVPSDQYDYAMIRLSKLLNTGSVSTSQDPLANRVTVRLVATVNNHSLNVPGESAFVTMGVAYADRQWVGISGVNFTNVANISSLPNQSLPIVSLSYVLGDEYFNLYETAVIEAVTSLRRGVTYAPMDFEFIAPYQNDSAVMTVCRAEVVSVGKYVGCSDKSSLLSKIRLTSKNNSTNYDKAVFSLGTTSNVGPASTNVTADDQIVMRFHVKMQNHLAHSSGNGSSYALSFGFQFSNDQIWIGQLAAVVTKPDVALAALTTNQEPYVTFDTSTVAAYPMDVVTLGLVIKLPSGSRSRFTLELTAPTFGAVCAASVVYTGANVSCVNSTAVTESAVRALFNTSAKEFLTQILTYDLGYLHNSGTFTVVKDATTDANTILLRVSLRTDASAVGNGTVTAKVSYSGGSKTATATVSVTSGVRPVTLTNETAPTFSVQMVPLIDGMSLSGQYAPGQGFRARLTMTTQPNSVQRIDVRFVTPVAEVNLIDLVDVGVVKVGRNLPCTVPWAAQANVTKRANSQSFDTAALNLGVVCNLKVSDLATDNQIEIDVFGRVWTNSSVMPFGEILLSTVVFVSDQQINVNQLNITVNKTATPPQYSLSGNTSSINASFDTTADIYGTVGGYVQVSMLLQVPEYFSSPFRMDLRNADVNESAWATVNQVNITASGSNMMGLANEPYLLSRTSSLNTYQLDSGELQVYSVQNSGLTSLKKSRFSAADKNNFTVTYSVRLADHRNASNGSTFQMSLGVSLLDKIVVGLRDIRVLRNNLESPDSTVQVNISALADVVYVSGMPVTVSVNITCLNSSTAELQDSIFFLHTPPYIQLLGLVSVQYASGNITAAERPDGGIKFVFSNTIFLAETVQFSFNISVRAGVTLPGGRETSNATSVYEFTYKMYERAGNANSGKWNRKSGSVFLQVKGASALPDPCSLDLGMNDSSIIRDCQISSFMAPFTGYEAHKSRPTLAGWKPHVRGGDYSNYRYVTVLFGTLKYVSRIVVYASAGNKPTCLNVYKTKDGRAFTLHQTYSIAAYYVGNTANFSLETKLLGRGIRIGVCGTTTLDSPVVVRFDLFGCNYTGVDSYPFDACTRRPYDQDTCSRSYLHTNDSTDTVYYCDHVPLSLEDLTGVAKCYKASGSQPRKWQYLGPAVGNVHSYHSATNKLFGFAQGCSGNATESRSFLVSEDGGTTWIPTNPESFKGVKLEAQNAGSSLVYSKTIDWVVDSYFAPGVNGSACTSYTAGNWNFCYDGIYHTSNQVVSWNSCCSL